jgi:outer membrane protein
MKKTLLFLFLFSLLVFPGAGKAQNIDTGKLPREWTLQQCIDYAKQNNIQLNSLRLSSASARQDLQQAGNNRLPSVSGSISHSWVHSKNTNPVVGGFQTQSRFSSNYGLNSSLTLYNGGYLKNNIRANELSVESANLSVEETANDITLSITQAFLNILLAKENIRTLEELVITSREQMALGQKRYDAGGISKKDLLQFESQVANDNYNLVNANNAFRSNSTLLKQLLQLPFSYDLVVAVPASIEPQELVMALPVAQKAALDSRPEVKNNEVAIRLAEVELDKVRAGGLPTVSLGTGLSSGFSDNQNNKYLTQLGDNFYQSLGLSASIPIFSRKLTRTNISKSKISIEQAKLALENTKTTLNQQVEQAYINLLNAQAQYAAAATQLKIAEETYRITNEQLRLGAINMTEVLQQKNSYVQALQAFIQAKYIAVLYNKIYRFYTGDPITF